MGLDWVIKSNVSGKDIWELVGGERVNLNNPSHLAILRKIIAVRRTCSQERSPPDTSRCLMCQAREAEEFDEHWAQHETVHFRYMSKGYIITNVSADLLARTDDMRIRTEFGFAWNDLQPQFRGKRLLGLLDLLGREIYDRAYEETDSAGMLTYANQLESRLPTNERLGYDFAEMLERCEREKHQMTSAPTSDEPGDFPESFWEAMAIQDAVIWLRFWAQYDVRMVPSS